MTKQDGIRLVTELEAERILLARGFTKETCKACEGVGVIEFTPSEEGPVGFASRRLCLLCDGATWIWKEPAA